MPVVAIVAGTGAVAIVVIAVAVLLLLLLLLLLLGGSFGLLFSLPLSRTQN